MGRRPPLRSASRWLRCFVACVTAISAGTTLGGCGSKQKVKTVGAPLKAPKQRFGYVRIAALVDGHPLQQDVRRLRAAEVRLDGLASHLPANDIGDSASLSGYVLPALNAQGLGNSGRAAASARKSRRTVARDKFARSVGDALNDYAAERSRRHQRLLDQRRVELLAVDASGEARSERAARDVEDAKARKAIDDIADNVFDAQAKIAILDAQLEDTSGETLPQVPNEATFEQQAEGLEKRPQPLGISMPVRLRVKRLEQVAALNKLKDDLDAIQRAGTGASDEAVRRIQNERLAEIDRQLAALSDDVRLRALLESEDSSMNDLLSAESRAADQFVSQGSVVEGPYGTSGAATLPIIFGARIGHLDRTGVAQAIARIKLQRERLERYIRLDVTTAIHDVASARNINVVGVDLGGSSHSPLPSVSGRSDMTAQFENWIQQPGQYVGASRGAGTDSGAGRHSGG